MNRQRFLSLIGLSVLGPLAISLKKGVPDDQRTDCNDPITLPVPEGPYYKDEKLNRMNIVEHKKGMPIEYRFMVEDQHCRPIEGAIVDIWQCDADGLYSDFKVEHTVSETWLRGYQYTDKEGNCRFHSIFPGWYTGRVTHLHAKVHVNSKTLLTTNLFFPKEVEDEIFRSPLYPKGPNPTPILQDFELKVDKDTKRFESLVMHIDKDHKGLLMGSYKFAVTV
jgi:protocatechuate 3,4-dioxygenase beta subunit